MSDISAVYTKEMLSSLAKVEAARAYNMAHTPPKLTEDEKQALVRAYHPDFREEAFSHLRTGASRGARAPIELIERLEAPSIAPKDMPALYDITYSADVLIIGGGGAGAAAAIEAARAGADVLIVTKGRFGDSNTVLAEGGIQAAATERDSLEAHYLDTFGGGGYAADPALVSKLVHDGPSALRFLIELGMRFDRDAEGELIALAGGGASRKRMFASLDSTGLELMRTLRDEVCSLGVRILERRRAAELIKDESGRVAGAVLIDDATGEVSLARAKCVILATGGAGSLRYQNFPSSNCGGALAEGLALAYRAGAKLIDLDAIQYHPTGAAFPAPLRGELVTEKARALGATLVNAEGKAFIDPLETRSVVTSAILRECGKNGIDTPSGKAVWLDTPMIDIVSGSGTIERALPGLFKKYLRHGIDIRESAIPVYPTLHYQCGGIAIGTNGETCVIGLYAAGECTGGIHGRNRLMGNSLLDIIVFGRSAGKAAASEARCAVCGSLTLAHTEEYARTLSEAKANEAREKLIAEALTHYALTGAKVTFIRHNENITCRVDSDDGRYVLRIRKPREGFTPGILSAGDPVSLMRSELALLRHIKKSAPFPVQTPLETLSGDDMCVLCDGTPACMLAWLEGEPLTKEDAPSLAYELGSMAAALDLSMEGFALHRYDYTHPIVPLLKSELAHACSASHITSEQLSSALAVLDELERVMEKLDSVSGAKRSIHADLGISNVLVTKSGLAPIDFSLSGLGYAPEECAMLSSDFTDDAVIARVLEGYRDGGGIEISPHENEVFTALGVLLFVASQHSWLWKEEWFPALMDRWCAGLFKSAAKE